MPLAAGLLCLLIYVLQLLLIKQQPISVDAIKWLAKPIHICSFIDLNYVFYSKRKGQAQIQPTNIYIHNTANHFASKVFYANFQTSV